MGATSPSPAAEADINGLVDVGAGRMMYGRCTGASSPTVILEGGDEDTSSSYGFAVQSLAAVTRRCAFDRANLGNSDPAPGPRGLPDW